MSGERITRVANGWVMFFVLLAVVVGAVVSFIWQAIEADRANGVDSGGVALFIGSVVAFVAALICMKGLFAVAPNQAEAMLLAGKYKGTVREPGFWWMNPLTKGIKISQRVRNLNSEKLKVNDVRGNPIEIGAVVVWRVTDTFKALFEVDDYVSFVNIQSESALRHLASEFPYDTVTDGEKSLRGSMDEVNATLQKELQARLEKAGIVVDEARLSHLAYAPEIAGAMLRRQQAEATVAARFKIVEGAVGMVESALEHLEKNKTVDMDPERKAAMVSNLLVVLCGEQAAQPVVNTGTLYSG